MKKVLLFFIQYYQVHISPNRLRTCNFHPTCSEYAKEAITVHGGWYGSYLAIKRFLKCHPFRKVTVDKVPPKRK